MIDLYGRYILASNIEAEDYSITLLDASNIGTSGEIEIEGERITFGSVSSNTLNINDRGVGVTNQSDHKQGADVWALISGNTVPEACISYMVKARVLPSDIGFTPKEIKWKINGENTNHENQCVFDGTYYNCVGPRQLSIAGTQVIEIEFTRDALSYVESKVVTVGSWSVIYVLDSGVFNKGAITTATTPGDPTVVKNGSIVSITSDMAAGSAQDWIQYVWVIGHSTDTLIDSIVVDWDDGNSAETFDLDGSAATSTNIPESPSNYINVRLSNTYTADGSSTIDVDLQDSSPSSIVSDTLDITVSRSSNLNVEQVLIERRIKSLNNEAYIPPSKTVTSWSSLGSSNVVTDTVDGKTYEYRVKYRTTNTNGISSTEKTIETNYSNWITW